ncbi:MAG: GNAT family N-acetyltransferase [Roseibium sp.]|uniref:GNAT family N-acetyltransferase n=1 Tax=Roseibium sp. TaxID=1936156 RepID=UPI001B1D0C61|nr:GNAT family N-acetyltransferase [Roseibium sp.]MBO6891206.1 GNAT family N-acetyltransferase [Roseibium sp.]MBO6928753.1 GNAT family N-acetyltransferase [Roseibium sp.]
MALQIADCRDIAPERLCFAVNDTFSDYVVPLTMTESQFVDFQRQRGFSPEHSFVALDGDRIAGFWFSSEPLKSYGNRGYTLSVGTSPQFRRQGISRHLFLAVSKALNVAGASGMQLEVVTSNPNAVATYEAFGFDKIRNLGVFKLPKRNVKTPENQADGVRIEVAENLPSDTEDFFDALPTPQNSRAAVDGLKPNTCIVLAKWDDSLIGWGAVYADGAVAQIAVRRDMRRQGVGRLLLAELANQISSDQFMFVNVDENAASLNGFLTRVGAEQVLSQFEMQKTFAAA